MKTRNFKMNGIDDYHKLEIEEIFIRTREHTNQRSQIFSFLGTAHLIALGIALTNQKISILILAISLPIALIIIDHGLKRSLASVELRGLQLEDLYAPDPETALQHLSISVGPINPKKILELKSINSLKEPQEKILALRRVRLGMTGSIGLPLLVILEIGMTLSFWLSGWKVF